MKKQKITYPRKIFKTEYQSVRCPKKGHAIRTNHCEKCKNYEGQSLGHIMCNYKGRKKK